MYVTMTVSLWKSHRIPETFQPNLKELEEKITAEDPCCDCKTPHNPTGVVYSEETIKKLAAILEEKQKEFGHSYLSDF